MECMLDCQINNVKGTRVTNVMRFKHKEGSNGDSPVLLTFEGNVMPGKVFLGSMAYKVREYKRPLLHCYNCHKFGQVAGSCLAKCKCGKCGGDHEYQACKAEAPKCCNCGGHHTKAFCECEHFVWAQRAQRVREHHKVSYAEAVNRVNREHGVGNKKANSIQQVSQLLQHSPQIILSREKFLAFIVDVLVGAQASVKRSDTIKIVVKAAERFLGVNQFLPEQLHEYMKA